MAYPQFALMTLQLIAPSSNMTLQEYKNAYGIDLTATDIHAFKLVLFGDQKYAIDQIKDVEDGYEIYFNGRILSITDTIETSDEVYDVVNSKPLYFHPISFDIWKSGLGAGRGCLSIINNSPEAINTMPKLLALVRSWGLNRATLNFNGAVSDGNGSVIVLTALAITSSNADFYGVKSDGTPSSAISVGDYTFPGFTDDVNKLN